jgi:hypothetical protein
MSRDEEAKNPRLFDVRAVERNIRKGLITRKDYEKHLKTLPDVTDKIAPRDAPAPAVAHNRPVEYVPPTIVVTPAPPSAEGADEGDDIDDELDDDDLEELDDDEADDEPNGARSGGEEPPKT